MYSRNGVYNNDQFRPFYWEGIMRNLVLILIVFLAVVTFIRAVDNTKTDDMHSPHRIESSINN